MPDYTGYDLLMTPDDIAFEIGAYEGAWTQYVAETYDPWVYAFEPAPRAYKVALDKLAEFPKVKLYNFGLGCRDGTFPLGDSDRDGAGFYKREAPYVQAQLVDVERFIQEEDISTITVMRVNIEGGEFELLPYLIGTGIIKMVHYLFMQWHYIKTIPDASPMRLAVDALLTCTHRAVNPSLDRNWAMWERLSERGSSQAETPE